MAKTSKLPPRQPVGLPWEEEQLAEEETSNAPVAPTTGRQPAKIAAPDGITLAKGKVRNRKFDRKYNHLSRTYRLIPDDVHDEVVRIAKKLGVPYGEVARTFLEHGIKSYKNGALKLNPQMRPSIHSPRTLYPDEIYEASDE